MRVNLLHFFITIPISGAWLWEKKRVSSMPFEKREQIKLVHLQMERIPFNLSGRQTRQRTSEWAPQPQSLLSRFGSEKTWFFILLLDDAWRKRRLSIWWWAGRILRGEDGSEESDHQVDDETHFQSMTAINNWNQLWFTKWQSRWL